MSSAMWCNLLSLFCVCAFTYFYWFPSIPRMCNWHPFHKLSTPLCPHPEKESPKFSESSEEVGCIWMHRNTCHRMKIFKMFLGHERRRKGSIMLIMLQFLFISALKC